MSTAMEPDFGDSKSLSRPPSPGDLLFDKIFRSVTFTFTLATILLLGLIVFKIGGQAIPAMWWAYTTTNLRLFPA